MELGGSGELTEKPARRGVWVRNQEVTRGRGREIRRQGETGGLGKDARKEGRQGAGREERRGLGLGGSVPGCPGARGTGTPRGEGRKAVSPSGTGSYKEGREELGERGRGIGKGRPESSQGWGVRLV